MGRVVVVFSGKKPSDGSVHDPVAASLVALLDELHWDDIHAAVADAADDKAVRCY